MTLLMCAMEPFSFWYYNIALPDIIIFTVIIFFAPINQVNSWGAIYRSSFYPQNYRNAEFQTGKKCPYFRNVIQNQTIMLIQQM